MEEIERIDKQITEVITDAPTNVKRLIAANLRENAEKTFYVESANRRMTYAECFAMMLWDIVTEGKVHFADGTAVQVDINQWTAIAKFLTTHLEGSASQDTTIGALNVYKVYMGFDEDRV